MTTRVAGRTNAVINAGTIVDDGSGAIGGVWTKSTSGTANAVANTATYAYGSQSVYMTVEGVAGSFVYITKTLGAAVNFTPYTHVGISMYLDSVYRGSEMSTGLQLFFSTDSGSFTNYYDLTETNDVCIKPGWNFINIPRSQFVSHGSPNWANINTIRVRLNGSNTQAKAIYYDGIVIGCRSRPKISFTFDDSFDSSYSQGHAYSNPRGVPLTHFAIGEYLSDPAQSGRTSIAQLNTMISAGDELCVHGPHNNQRWDIDPIAIPNALNALWSLGLSPLMHGAYPNGEFGQTQSTAGLSISTVFALMAQYKMISGRTTTTLNNSSNYTGGSLAGHGSPYAIPSASLGSATSLASAKTMIDLAVQSGGYQIFTLHQLDVTASSATTWAISDWQALVDYALAYKNRGQADIVTYSKIVQAECLNSWLRAS